MFYGMHPGWIEVISGVMFSGKSEELIRRVRRAIIARRKVQVFKSHLDSRYAGALQRLQPRRDRVGGHPGGFRRARSSGWSAPTPRSSRSTRPSFSIPQIVTWPPRWPAAGVRVILAGTDTDFRGEPFGSMGELMAVAEMVDKLQAICVVCGDPACRNQRLIDGKPARYDSPTIMIGGRESYQARCRHCHQVPRQDEDQTALLCSLLGLRAAHALMMIASA